MKVLVTGGRDYPNWQRVHALLSKLHERYGITKIIQGCAQGTDAHASNWARLNKVEDTLDTYKPDWDNVGKSAGIKRNATMHDNERPDLVIGFPGDNGTKHMTQYAVGQGTPTMVVPDLEWERTKRLPLEDLDDLIVEVAFDEDGEELVYDDEPRWLLKPKRDFPKRVHVSAPTPAGRYDETTMF